MRGEIDEWVGWKGNECVAWVFEGLDFEKKELRRERSVLEDFD